MSYNSAGQEHANDYSPPKNDATLLRYPDGTPTGATLDRALLIYNDGVGVNGQIRLDNHELPVADTGWRQVFARGGKGYTWPTEYGHVRLSDLTTGTVSAPVASGGGRGAAATVGDEFEIVVVACPDVMKYKPFSPGSSIDTYCDSGQKYDRPGEYTYLCWSCVNVAGGGEVRALLRNGSRIRECPAVSRVHTPSYDPDTGAQNGVAVWAYVEQHGLYGWMVWEHEFDGAKTWHVAAV
jgi:hypothetical protein